MPRPEDFDEAKYRLAFLDPIPYEIIETETPSPRSVTTAWLERLAAKEPQVTWNDNDPELKKYREDMEGRTFSDDSGEYHVGDLLYFADKAKKKTEEVSVEDLLPNFEGMSTDEPVGSPAWRNRSMKADLKYPILLLREKDGSLTVMDGLHRLWKANHLKNKALKAQIIDHSELVGLPQVASTEDSKGKPSPKGDFQTFLDEQYEGGSKKVPNPNVKTRKLRPEVTVGYVLKKWPKSSVAKSVIKEFKAWKSRRIVASQWLFQQLNH